jgi:hypothetical protein
MALVSCSKSNVKGSGPAKRRASLTDANGEPAGKAGFEISAVMRRSPP